ncbi:uncharacterized protein LOC108913690, partial [Anoplophora glabripennis]|uniref:uncharacterized protein LOC108913690 n=1 Tax=Anoplophora glabripennis TaxID=217634 RepID=UPI0008740A1C
MPKKGKKRLTQRKGTCIRGQPTRRSVPEEMAEDTNSSSSVELPPPLIVPSAEAAVTVHGDIPHVVEIQQHIVQPVAAVQDKNSTINRMPSDSSTGDLVKTAPSTSLAPTRLLKRKFSSDSEDEPPQIITVEVMIHQNADAHIEQNFPGPSSPIAASTHSNNTPVPILTPPMPQDVIEIDVENIGDGIIPELSPSLLDDLQNEFADLPFNNRRQTANQMDAAIGDIPTREDIQQDIERLRNIENHLPTYLLASERIVPGGTYNLGPLDQICTHCSAFYFRVESTVRGHYTKCCQQGNVILENFPPMPDVLEALFQGLHPSSANFRRHILLYNYSFQFVSLEANLRDLPARGPYVFCVRGKVYHHISNVNINEPLQRYGPIYFLDPDEAIDARAQNNNQVLDRRLIVLLEQLLRNINPYARAYMHLRERYNLELQTIDRLRTEAVRNNVVPPPLQMPNVTLELLNVRGMNRRQYDLPRVEEVAAVYNLMPDAPATPNMRIYVRDEPTRFQNVSEESEHNDPLVFPLLFPHGESGWYIGIPHRNGNRNTTLCEYYAYRFGIRNNDTRLKYGGRLTQQFAVAAYIKIENNRLKYILRNQERLRVTEYVGLADYLHRRVQEGNEDDDAATLGRMVILPSTFVGSPRYQQQLFQDAMAVVGRFGIPSLFITMTTNARWTEIVDNIPAGYTASDHPSLMDRVFQCKLNEMVDDMLKKHIFGIHVANLYVIEFQKRGLPHCHNLLILRDQDKLTDPRRIDALISAEIPDPQLEPELYEIVTSFMVHGPCGELNPESVCMVNGQCSKKYPKEFSEFTVISEKGQVIYKRPNNGRTLTIRANNRNCILDNRWIVPYNPYILLKYKCHINIEACATTQCVKYLYKYLFKGVDLALVRINVENQANYNEVENYLNARYMTPPEACWHINQFETHKNTHTVYRLCVHLPTRQMVRFQPGFEIQALENNEITQLTAWFLLNQNDPDARQYLYTDIPYHYVWNNRTKRWTRRQRGANKIVTRMYSVSIRNQELYYLRLLLLHVPGASSYEELRALNGVIYDTFKEACQHRNLLADD